jgi:hypothetical protein
MSRDIPDRVRCFVRVVGLVLLGGLDGELGEESAVVGDDSDLAVGGEDQDGGAGVAASDAEEAGKGRVAARAWTCAKALR